MLSEKVKNEINNCIDDIGYLYVLKDKKFWLFETFKHYEKIENFIKQIDFDLKANGIESCFLNFIKYIKYIPNDVYNDENYIAIDVEKLKLKTNENNKIIILSEADVIKEFLTSDYLTKNEVEERYKDYFYIAQKNNYEEKYKLLLQKLLSNKEYEKQLFTDVMGNLSIVECEKQIRMFKKSKRSHMTNDFYEFFVNFKNEVEAFKKKEFYNKPLFKKIYKKELLKTLSEDEILIL